MFSRVFTTNDGSGGFSIFTKRNDDGTLSARFATRFSGIGNAPDFFTTSITDDQSWHFYRFVYLPETRTTTACIDGTELRTYESVFDEHFVDTNLAPQFGKRLNSSELATLESNIDDVRIISAALPCEDTPQ